MTAELVAFLVLALLIGWLGLVLGGTWHQLRTESDAQRARRDPPR
jgi:hypothetical protein